MASSLSKLVDNLSEEIHNNKCSDCGYIKLWIILKLRQNVKMKS